LFTAAAAVANPARSAQRSGGRELEKIQLLRSEEPEFPNGNGFSSVYFPFFTRKPPVSASRDVFFPVHVPASADFREVKRIFSSSPERRRPRTNMAANQTG